MWPSLLIPKTFPPALGPELSVVLLQPPNNSPGLVWVVFPTCKDERCQCMSRACFSMESDGLLVRPKVRGSKAHNFYIEMFGPCFPEHYTNTEVSKHSQCK